MSALLRLEDFDLILHQRAFLALQAIVARGGAPDVVALGGELNDRGELEVPGGGAELLALVQYGSEWAIDTHCARIRELAQRRRAIEAARRLQEGSRDRTRPLVEVLAEVRERVAAIESDSAVSGRLVHAALSLREAVARPEPEFRAFYSDGAFPLGCYSIVAGDGEIGKTRLMLRMIVRRCLNRTWQGWEPTTERFSALVLALESGFGRGPVTRLLERLARDEGGEAAWEAVQDQVHVIGFPEHEKAFHCSEEGTDELIEAIERVGSSFTLIDSVTEIKSDPSDTPEAYAPVIRTLGDAAKATETDITGIHHNRREPPGKNGKSDPTDRIRGPATFINGSRFRLALDESHGKRRIISAKVSFGPKHAPSFYEFDATGLPVETEAPEAHATKGDRTRALVLDALRGLLGRVTAAEVRKRLGEDAPTEKTIKEHLDALVEKELAIDCGERKTGRAKPRLWVAAGTDAAHAGDDAQNGDVQREML